MSRDVKSLALLGVAFTLQCSTVAAQLFTNGDFATGDFTGWQTINHLNSGLTLDASGKPIFATTPPGGSFTSQVLTGNPGSIIDPIMNITLPKYGNTVAKVRGDGGRYVNSIANTGTVTPSDFDPSDNQLHIRFAWAAALENPSGHRLEEQPFFLVAIRNMTQATGLYSVVKFADKYDPLWKSSTTWLYSDWQVFDQGFPNGIVNIGDQIEIEAMAGGCSRGAHAGYVYLSAFGSTPPTTKQVLSLTKTGVGYGRVFSSLTGIDCKESCPFQSANYNNGDSVTLTVQPNNISTFTGWSGDCTGTALTCVVLMNGTKNVIANFDIINPPALQVQFRGMGSGAVTSVPSGISCSGGSGDCNEIYSAGQTVNLTATPNACSTFFIWNDDCTGTSQTCALTMDNNKLATVAFYPIIYALTATTIGGAGSISSNPSGIDCGTQCNETFACSQAVKLTATPDPGYRFTSWNGDCAGTANTCTVSMNADKNITANFAPIPYTLKIGKTGTGKGTIKSQAAGGSYDGLIDCGSACRWDYFLNTVVTLKAIPDPGSSFLMWRNSCVGTNPITTVKMNTGRYCVAIFKKP